MDVVQVRQRRLSDDIVERLETMILEGALKAGERLPAERVLAERFGVSRPSLREAIQKLVAKGLLVSRQGGGNYVAAELGSTFSDPLLHLLESNPDAQRDLLEFRHTLEGSCAFYAAQRATPVDHERLRAAFDELQRCYAPNSKASRAEEGAADARFHLAIAQASHNPFFVTTIATSVAPIRQFTELARNVTDKKSPTRVRATQAEHQAIVDAIVRRSSGDAAEAIRIHILNAKRRIFENTPLR